MNENLFGGNATNVEEVLNSGRLFPEMQHLGVKFFIDYGEVYFKLYFAKCLESEDYEKCSFMSNLEVLYLQDRDNIIEKYLDNFIEMVYSNLFLRVAMCSNIIVSKYTLTDNGNDGIGCRVTSTGEHVHFKDYIREVLQLDQPYKRN